MTAKITREFYGNRQKQESDTKRRMSRAIAFKTAAFLAKGGEIQQIADGVSGAKPYKMRINPNRNWAQGPKK